MALDINTLTQKDLDFLGKLKQQGVSKEEAFMRLEAVKTKVTETGLQQSGLPQEKSGRFKVSSMKDVEQLPEELQEQAREGVRRGPFRAGREVIEDIVQTAGQGLKTFGEGAVEQIKEPFTPVKEDEVSGEGFRKMVQGGLQTLLSPVAGILQNVPGGEKIAETLSIPTEAVGSLYEKIAESAGVDTSSEAFQEAKEQIMLGFDVGTLAVGPKATKTIKRAAESIPVPSFGGKQLKEFGRTIAEKTLPTTTKEAELMQKFEAGIGQRPRTIGETAVERDISGTRRGVGTAAEAESSRIFTEEINPALKEAGVTLTKDELFSAIEDKIANTIEPGRKKGFQDAYEVIKEEYADTVGFELPEAQSVKSSLDEFTPQKAFKGKEVASEYNQLRNVMANKIRQFTYETLKDADIKAKYLDYVNLQELKKLGITARTSKGGFLKPGGTQSLLRDIWDMTVTPISTKAGTTLYKVGDYLEFESPSKITKFSEYVEDVLGVDKETFLSQMIGVGPTLEEATQ